MEPVLVMSKNNCLCLIMPTKLLEFVSTYFSLVGNLDHNTTRFSLSDEPSC